MRTNSRFVVTTPLSSLANESIVVGQSFTVKCCRCMKMAVVRMDAKDYAIEVWCNRDCRALPIIMLKMYLNGLSEEQRDDYYYRKIMASCKETSNECLIPTIDTIVYNGVQKTPRRVAWSTWEEAKGELVKECVMGSFVCCKREHMLARQIRIFKNEWVTL